MRKADRDVPAPLSAASLRGGGQVHDGDRGAAPTGDPPFPGGAGGAPATGESASLAQAARDRLLSRLHLAHLLTPMERQTLEDYAALHSAAAVAEARVCSVRTVQKHRENARRKLQCHTTQEACQLLALSDAEEIRNIA